MTIQHSHTTLSEVDIQSAIEQIRTGVINDSDVTREFEKSFAHYVGTKTATATSTGTLGLILALKRLGINNGDKVLTSTYVCDDVAKAIAYVGAIPVYADISPLDFNMSPEDAYKKTKQWNPSAIIVPHIFGAPADIRALMELEIPIIEDCSHAVGCSIDGKKLGSLGVAGVFSFHALKGLVCGEGGMVTWSDEYTTPKKSEIDYHLSNILSAIGLSQLQRIDKILEKRKEIEKGYKALLKNDTVLSTCRLPSIARGEGALLRYNIICPEGVSFTDIQSLMRKEDIVVQRSVKSLLHKEEDSLNANCPVSESLFNRIISLPAHLQITPADQNKIARSLSACLSQLI